MGSDRLSKLLEFHAEDPDDPFLCFAVAMEYLNTGSEPTALTWFEDLVERHPNYIGTYYHLGKLYLRMGRREDALQTFDAGINAASAAGDTHAASELRSAKMELEIEG